MAKRTAPLLPTTEDLLHRFGDRLRLARRRRQLSAKQVAERAGMAPMTLRSLERGGSGVTMGAYLAVMQVLGIEKDLNLLGKADPMGRELQDSRLSAPTKVARANLPAAKRPKAASKQGKGVVDRLNGAIPKTKRPKKLRKPAKDPQDWIETGKFTSSESLAGLIGFAASSKKKKGR